MLHHVLSSTFLWCRLNCAQFSDFGVSYETKVEKKTRISNAIQYNHFVKSNMNPYPSQGVY